MESWVETEREGGGVERKTGRSQKYETKKERKRSRGGEGRKVAKKLL